MKYNKALEYQLAESNRRLIVQRAWKEARSMPLPTFMSLLELMKNPSQRAMRASWSAEGAAISWINGDLTVIDPDGTITSDGDSRMVKRRSH